MGSELVSEASGIVASRRHPGLYWVHNDSGGTSRVFAIRADGTLVAQMRVRGATAVDWEDIGIGPGPNRTVDGAKIAGAESDVAVPWLYVADTGNNNGARRDLRIYRFPEPPLDPRAVGQRGTTAPAEAIVFRYPGAEPSRDCEAIVVHPKRPEVWLFTKQARGMTVFRLDVSRPDRAVRVASGGATLSVGALVTGAAISPDGQRLALRFYWGLCEIAAPSPRCVLDGLDRQPLRPAASAGPSNRRPVWLRAPIERQGEAVCYSIGGDALLTVSEGKSMPVWRLQRAAAERERGEGDRR